MEKKARYSRQREAILNYLKGTTAHPTAEQIYSDLKGDYPELSLATVYRNLGYLLNNGEIMKINIEGTTVRYDYTTNCHYNLVCRECGGVFDLKLDSLEELDKKAESSNGCRIDSHELTFYGLCAGCVEKNKKLN